MLVSKLFFLYLTKLECNVWQPVHLWLHRTHTNKQGNMAISVPIVFIIKLYSMGIVYYVNV